MSRHHTYLQFYKPFPHAVVLAGSTNIEVTSQVTIVRIGTKVRVEPGEHIAVYVLRMCVVNTLRDASRAVLTDTIKHLRVAATPQRGTSPPPLLPSPPPAPPAPPPPLAAHASLLPLPSPPTFTLYSLFRVRSQLY